MRISVVVPCFNEAPRLPKTFREISEFSEKNNGKSCVIAEIIVVDDGSTDATVQVAHEWAISLPIRIIRHERNFGKGRALRTGVMQSIGDCVLLFDADSATSISELPKFCDAMRAQGSDIVIGCRVPRHAANVTVRMSFYRKMIGRAYHTVTMLLIPGIADAACGFKLLRTQRAKELFAAQQIERFAYDIEILAAALYRQWKILEIPVNWNAVPISKVHVVRDGIEMLARIMQLYAWRILRRGVFSKTCKY